MNAQAILLFCQYFPYKGGEQFLFNEAEYYTENTEIYVCSQNNRTRPTIDLPANILITDFDFGKLPAVRGIIRTYWKLIIRVFLTEFYHSPHRYRYFRYFKTHFFLLVGYLQKAQVIKNQLPKNRKIKIYSYWFDEWATIIHLLKRISNDQLYIICRMHGYDFDEAQVERGYHLFRYFDLSGFDKVISVSDYGRNYIRRKYNFSGVEVHKLGVRDNSKILTKV